MTSPRRRIAVFTGNRSEYGLLYPILRAIAADERLDACVVASGAHLEDSLGGTLAEIEADGFRVHATVAVDVPEDTLLSTTRAIGARLQGLASVLDSIRPDLLIVYGDRAEAFAAVVAGTQMGIATAHVEGGDYTEGGSLDDSVRHAMTKLSHLHFTTHSAARERVLGLGEEAWRVHDVGYPALDLIAAGEYAGPREVRDRLDLDARHPLLVFTQHAVATEFGQAVAQVVPSLEALEEAHRRWGCEVILTYPNDDAGGRRIVREIEAFGDRTRGFSRVHPSMGRFLYHGVLGIAAACVGNSSSGIKEAPAFHCPTVNIGTRQQGRLRAANVIDTGYDREEILAALDRCLHDPAFLNEVRTCQNPYGRGDASRRIAEILATVPLDERLIRKKMTY